MKKPMLALFSTPNENYFFDVNRNEVVPISDASYAYLQQALGGKGTDLPAPAQVNMLKEQGYFSTESYIKEVRIFTRITSASFLHAS